MSDFWAALALVLVLEGMMPFLSPQGYRETVRKLAEIPDRQLRIFGFISMVLGVLFLYLVRG